MELLKVAEVESSGGEPRLQNATRSLGGKLHAFAYYCYSLCGLAAFTWLAFQLRFDFPSAGFLYLIVVVLTAEYAGFLAATVTSIGAVVCLDYLFEAPIFNFSVGERADWLAFAAFEFTALVISRLALRAHLKATEAEARHQDSE